MGTLVETAIDLTAPKPGARALHAAGVLCHATFTPTAAARELSRAPHFAGPPVRGHVRFSNASGDPAAHDGARGGRGIALKLYLDDGTTTDVLGTTTPTFVARTPEDFVALLEARRPDPETGQPDMAKIGAHLEAHPEALPAIQAVLGTPPPESYARVAFNSLHAYGFVAADGTRRHGRYRFEPLAGVATIPDEDATAKEPRYLAAELEERLAAGPVAFSLLLTLAQDGDSLDDPTSPWPDDRERIELGRIEVTGIANDRERDGDILVFDPTRVPDGIELTDDPILAFRPLAYSESVRRRTDG